MLNRCCLSMFGTTSVSTQLKSCGVTVPRLSHLIPPICNTAQTNSQKAECSTIVMLEAVTVICLFSNLLRKYPIYHFSCMLLTNQESFSSLLNSCCTNHHFASHLIPSDATAVHLSLQQNSTAFIRALQWPPVSWFKSNKVISW